MKWAFWRRRKPRVSDSGRVDARTADRSEESTAEQAATRAGEAAKVRARMRHRLIGAAVLLLTTAVVVPMLLDPTPRPLPDSIPIDIPSERTAFAPRLTLPQESGSTATAASHGAGEAAEEPPQAVLDAAAPAAPARDAGGDKAPAPAAGTHADAGRFIVQAAALSTQAAARQLSERLVKSGLSAFVEKADAPEGTVYRVRIGPYGSREAALKARRHLRSMGVSSNVVRIE